MKLFSAPCVLATWISILFLFCSCQSKPARQGETFAIDKNDPLLAMGARPLTFAGSNSQVQASPDQSRLIYVSEKRRAHEQAQIYEYDFLTAKERRLTFQDEINVSPSYLSDDDFLYSSSTDEYKEELFSNGTLQKNISKEQALEIYKSDLQGSEIHRWTHHKGADNQAQPWKGGIVYVSAEDAKSEIIFKSNEKSAPISLHRTDQAKISGLKKTDKQLLWIESKAGESTIRSYTSIKEKRNLILTTDGEFQAIDQGPQPETWVLSYRAKEAKDFQLILYQKNEQCWTPLLQFKSHSLLDPTLLEQKPRRLVFTRKTAEQSQIYMMDWPTQMTTCQPLKSPDKLEL